MTTIRAMTFNINGAIYPQSGPKSWGQRASVNVNLIKRYTPDLIGLQEVNKGNLATYATQLTEYHYAVGNAYGDNPPAEYTSIFWKATRFSCLESGEFWLSRTPDEPSSDWGVPYPMGATWVHLRDQATGLHLLHLNTHFEDGPDGEQSRVEGSKLIVARIAQLAPAFAVIVTGDFNCNPTSPTYNHFIAAGFSDAYVAAGNIDGAASTFHGFVGEQYNALEWGGNDPFWRVDWILVRSGQQPTQIRSCTIIRDAEAPIYPSDHYPVIADIVLNR